MREVTIETTWICPQCKTAYRMVAAGELGDPTEDGFTVRVREVRFRRSVPLPADPCCILEIQRAEPRLRPTDEAIEADSIDEGLAEADGCDCQ